MQSSKDPNNDFEDIDKFLRVYLIAIIIFGIIVFVLTNTIINL